jgi:hypothetical protein
MAALARRLRETLPTPIASAFSADNLLGNYLLIVGKQTFVGSMLKASLCFGILFA